MDDPHDRLREWAGAYTMGALDADDRHEFERHLRDCPRCQAAVGELAALPGLLAQIDPALLDDVPDASTAAAIEARARAETRRLVTSRGRWRRLGIGAAAGLLIVAVGAVAMWPRDASAPSDAAVELPVEATLAQAASIRAEAKGWGTELHAELTGLPDRSVYQLWTVDRAGTWVVAATWGPTETGGARVTGASSTMLDEVARIVVTSHDPADVLVDAAPAG